MAQSMDQPINVPSKLIAKDMIEAAPASSTLLPSQLKNPPEVSINPSLLNISPAATSASSSVANTAAPVLQENQDNLPLFLKPSPVKGSRKSATKHVAFNSMPSSASVAVKSLSPIVDAAKSSPELPVTKMPDRLQSVQVQQRQQEFRELEHIQRDQQRSPEKKIKQNMPIDVDSQCETVAGKLFLF